MKPELDHLRRFRAGEGVPDPVARATARAALLRRIEAASQPALAPALPKRRGTPRRPLLAAIGGLGLAASAALAVALVSGLGGGELQPVPATAAQLLDRAAEGAAARPYTPLAAGRYWYSRTEGESEISGGGGGRPALTVTLPVVHEEWTAPRRWGRMRVEWGTRARFPTALAKRNWIAAGRPWAGSGDDNRVAPSDGDGESLATPGSLTPRTLRALPTDPDALYAAIAAIARRNVREQRLPQRAFAEQVWTRATSLLSETAAPTPPALRAALYRVLARTPGVELRGRTTDALGRPGSVVALTVSGNRRELVLDPATGTLLEERVTALRDRYSYTGDWKPIPESRVPAGWTTRVTHIASGAVDSTRARP